MSASMNDFITDTTLRMSAESALNLAYGDDPYRPDISEIVGEALTVAASDIRDSADDLKACTKHDNCAAKAGVLRRLAEFLETGIAPEVVS